MAYDSANEIIRETLAELGLDGLTNFAWDTYKRTGSFEQVFFEVRNRPEYKARFAGNEALRKRGERPLTEAEYLNWETSARQMMRAAGFPDHFYDQPSDFARWIGGGVSPREFQERVDTAQRAVFESPPENRAEIERLYGVGAGDLMAWALDEKIALPLLQKRFLAGQIGGASQRSGYGALTRREAEELTQRMGADQADERFAVLGESKELFQSMGAEDEIGRKDQLGSISGNSQAARRVEQRRRQRQAEYQGGAGYATNREGIVGLQ